MTSSELLEAVNQLVDSGYGDYPVNVVCDGDVYSDTEVSGRWSTVRISVRIMDYDSPDYHGRYCTLAEIADACQDVTDYAQNEMGNDDGDVDIIVPLVGTFDATDVWIEEPLAYISC